MSKQVWKLCVVLLIVISLVSCGGSSTEPDTDDGDGPAQAPAAPTEVTATPGFGYITVTWKDNSDNETGFVIYRETLDLNEGMQQLAEVGENQTTYTDNGVTEGISYTYAVTAKNAEGETPQVPQAGEPVIPEDDDGDGLDVTVTVSPNSVELAPGDTQTFSASVEGSDDTSVTWGSSGGTIDADGLFTAPAEAGDYTVTATSQIDPSAQASASVTVTAEPEEPEQPEPNTPPVINSFSASPASGQVPQEVTFSWEVSDADGDETHL